MKKELLRENIDFIRIFLFFVLFKDVNKTCNYFSVSRTSFLQALNNIEKNFRLNLFIDRRNYYLTDDGKTFFDYSYNLLILLKKTFYFKKNFLDIGYLELLSKKDILNLCKYVYTNTFLKLSFTLFEEDEILKLVYLNELDFGVVSYINQEYFYLEYIKLDYLSFKWNLYSKKDDFYGYAQYIYKFISELFLNKNVIIKSNNLDFILECIKTNKLASYLPDYISNKDEQLLTLEKTNINTNLYLTYNSRIINDTHNLFIKVIKSLFCENS
ncbi:MAG: hypothetical protein KatS3mg068_0427 [Candidatus Sericytochromatia bacterium]|nr:MAG: hypothetical protein KatS3mg068_0427 [Candidatus Sericytochromatia bacterium]